MVFTNMSVSNDLVVRALAWFCPINEKSTVKVFEIHIRNCIWLKPTASFLNSNLQRVKAWPSDSNKLVLMNSVLSIKCVVEPTYRISSYVKFVLNFWFYEI